MTEDNTQSEEGGMSVGMVDVVLFVGFVIAISGVVYSRMFRKKKDERSTLSLSSGA